LFKGNKSLLNDNSQSRNSIKISCCVWQLDGTSDVMAMTLETQIICYFVDVWFKRKLKWFQF